MVSILTRVSSCAGDRVGDIEAIQRVVGLVGAAAVEMRPAGVVLHHAVHQRQRVAVVLRGRVGDGLNSVLSSSLWSAGCCGSMAGGDEVTSIRSENSWRWFRVMVSWLGPRRMSGLALIEVEPLAFGADLVFAGGRRGSD